MNPEPYFSVIVCLYNAEKYFSDGVACMSCQTFRDFELILVDDGSTDGTAALCDACAGKSCGIKVIHQQNTGLGGARNRGLGAAAGRYVCFFDIDDKVGGDWLERLHDRLEACSGTELLIYGYREHSTVYGSVAEFSFEDRTYRTNGELRDAYAKHLSGMRFNNGFAWNKVYRLDFLRNNGLAFPDARIQQDELFNIEVYKKVERAASVSDVLYDYFVYEGGNIRSAFIPERTGVFTGVRAAFLELASCWDLQDEDFLLYVHERYIRSLLFNGNKTSGCREKTAYWRTVMSMDEARESARRILDADRKGGFILKAWCRAIERKSLCSMKLLQGAEDVKRVAGRIVRKICGNV